MLITDINKDTPILKYGRLENGEIHYLKRDDDPTQNRVIGMGEGRLCLYYDVPFTDRNGNVIGFGSCHVPIVAMADTIDELESSGMSQNVKDISPDDLRLYVKLLTDVLNKNDIEKFKAFFRKWSFLTGGKEPSDEMVWEITLRKMQYNAKCYPKVRKEAKKWLLENGFSLNIGGKE